MDKRIKFLNQFYMFNGFNKYIEQQINGKDNNKLSQIERETLIKNLKLINTNLDKKEKEVMRIFDCDTNWPLCLYDFTIKNRNNTQITMRSRYNLKDYVVENYFREDGIVSNNKKNYYYRNKLYEDDIIRERQ